MIGSIELQIISKLVTSDNDTEIDALLQYDSSYYSAFKEHIQFIFDHKSEYGCVPDVFTFQAQFPDIELIRVTEPLSYLVREIKKNKQHIMLIETFNKLKDLGAGDVEDAWKYLSIQCDTVNELSEFAPMDIVKQARQRADQIKLYSQQQRIPTGFKEIDNLMHGGLSTVEELVLIVARTNTGKAQPLWSKVLTPTGWTTMGELKVGDVVVGKNNDNGKVVKIFPQGVKDYYKVTFDDNTSTYCCDDHLWEVTRSHHRTQPEVLTTRDIRMNTRAKYSVDISEAIEFDESVSTQYLRSSKYLRYELLAALLHTNTDCLKYDRCWNFDTDSDKLASELAELARSLGMYVRVEKSNDNYSIAVRSRPDSSPFRKEIVSIEYAGQTECQCILLDNETHTYLTDDYIVTHNSWVCTKMMESAQGSGFPVLYYSPEMQASYLGTRFDTWRNNFKNSELYKGHYTKEYVEYLTQLEDSDTSAYILEDKDTASGLVNVSAIEAVVKQRGIKLVIIDGLSYMEDEKRADSDYIRYKNICLGLFKISKKYGCAVVIAMQANRDTANTKDEKGEPFPGLYQVEGSDHPARICTQAFALRQIFDKQVLDIRLEKSRNANNQKPILSYAWDVNTGNMRYLPSGDSEIDSPASPTISPNLSNTSIPEWSSEDDDIGDDDIEF